jgi:hypothetical protein
MNKIGESNYKTQYYERHKVDNKQQNLKEVSVDDKTVKPENRDSFIFLRRNPRPRKLEEPIHRRHPRYPRHEPEVHPYPQPIAIKHEKPQVHGEPIQKPHPVDHNGPEHIRRKPLRHDEPTYRPPQERPIRKVRTGMEIDVHV